MEKEAVRQESTTVKQLLKDFAENTSMHGLGRVVSSRFLWLRLLWALLVLAGAGVAIYNLIKIILLFLDYPVSTVVTLEYASKIQFPAVTICNLNLLRKTQLNQNINLQGLKDIHYDDEDNTTQAPTGSTPEFEYEDDFDAAAVMDEDYKIRFFLANVDRNVRKDFGHQLRDMLVSCSYQSIDCTADNFTELYNREFGNCYTFNKEVTANQVSKSGPKHGLKLLLNVEEDEYARITDTVGFKIIIHPPDYMPFPEDEGILISPGFASSIAVSKLDIKRTEAPYGKCVNYGKDDHKHLNMYADLFDVGYSDKACHRTCLQTAMYENCNCCHRDFPCYVTKADQSHPEIEFCNYSNPDMDLCSYKVELMWQEDQLGCADRCIPACQETTYTSEVSSARWPSQAREAMTALFLDQHPSTQGKIVDATYVRNNIAKVIIHFKQLNYELIETSPAYDWSRLVSDLGGQFGLWLGFSLLTAVELIQLLFDICHHVGGQVCCGGRQGSARRREVKPIQGLDQ